jgi:hypothetical protein
MNDNTIWVGHKEAAAYFGSCWDIDLRDDSPEFVPKIRDPTSRRISAFAHFKVAVSLQKPPR